jgi:hypothetical protein
MNRLEAELRRLYLFPDADRAAGAAEERVLAGPDGRVRALVLELAAPGGWEVLAKVWQGVQADLELPAPAIAVSGSGYQLWFSLSQPAAGAQAQAFLQALARRYLRDVAPGRIGTQPAGAIPPFQVKPDRWSAFLTPDLAALFADEPWLDLPPGLDAQADLLSRLQNIQPEEWARAMERLTPAVEVESAQDTPSAALANRADPRRFLLEVMNDGAVELQLRIEAAKALLPWYEGVRPLDREQR